MCKKLYGKYACSCVVELIHTDKCGLKKDAEKLRDEGENPNGLRIRALEHSCKVGERIEYKPRDYKCTPCYVAMYK